MLAVLPNNVVSDFPYVWPFIYEDDPVRRVAMEAIRLHESYGQLVRPVDSVLNPPAVSFGISKTAPSWQWRVSIRVREGTVSIDDLKQFVLKNDVDWASVDLCRTGRLHPCTRRRPVDPGISSISHVNCSYGTLGAYVEDGLGRICALSNNHVLADTGRGTPGDIVIQPGKNDGGTKTDAVGTLATFQTLHQLPTVNLIDIALAELCPQVMPTNPKTIPNIGRLKGMVSILDTMQMMNTRSAYLVKQGRSTSPQHVGIASGWSITEDLEYPDGRTYRFGTVLEIRPEDYWRKPFAMMGDSGSIVVDLHKQVHGLLFATDDQGWGYVNPIEFVRSCHDVAISNMRV